jgi:hypothetical protein
VVFHSVSYLQTSVKKRENSLMHYFSGAMRNFSQNDREKKNKNNIPIEMQSIPGHMQNQVFLFHFGRGRLTEPTVRDLCSCCALSPPSVPCTELNALLRDLISSLQ